MGQTVVVEVLSRDVAAQSSRYTLAPWDPHKLVVRARAPLRLGLAGGGTDLSPYCDRHGGAVLNATIGRYAYAHLRFREDHKLCFAAHDVNEQDVVALAPELPTSTGLILHRAVHNRIVRDYLRGKIYSVTVTSSVDAPPGSGLGASSALIVALVEAYRAAFCLPLGRYDVARLAYEIERKDLALAGGRQDQYAAAFGGVNYMEFLPNDRVIVNPLRIDASHLSEFETSLVVCFTGVSRASAVIQQQVNALTDHDANTLSALHDLKADAIAMKHGLLMGDIGLIADLLNRSWKSKQKTSALVSNEKVENALSLGFRNGALAGKVSGAGGGGFVMFIANPERRYRLICALTEAGFMASSVQFTSYGAEAWATQWPLSEGRQADADVQLVHSPNDCS